MTTVESLQTTQEAQTFDATRADACYLALKSRDARFDGRFFIGVTSTKIYCRPVCKVKVPLRKNCRFFDHAAQAESAGFRPCLRCRPELAPQVLHWSTQDASAMLSEQAARLLDDPESWGNGGSKPDAAGGASIEKLSRRLGLSDRHVRRIFEAQFGVSPLQYLQTRRLLAAKQMLTDTDLPVTQVALSSGFASVRRFNAAFVGHYKLNPTALRRQRVGGVVDADQTGGASATVRLAYRPPYDVAAMLAFVQKRAIGSVTLVDPEIEIATKSVASCAHSTRLRTTFYLKNSDLQGDAASAGVTGNPHAGWLSAAFDEANSQVLLTVSDSLLDVLPLVIRRVRHWLDLDADPGAIHQLMGGRFPLGAGLRVPGCLDGFELAVRAVLGQQITVAAARTLAQRLVDKFGAPIETPFKAPFPGLTRLFPAPEVLADASGDALGSLGIVKQRQAAIVAIARAVAEKRIMLSAGADVPATMAALKELPGIGDWTAHYIAMRALRWPDAFPAGDIALHKALGVDKPLWGTKAAAKEIEAMSEAWKPWRSYAVVRAWATL
jgi:AraC family transcriptional regulator, regulatory protein of adaptative response / DNA-3-methyladenine glycosylase II